MGKPNLDISRMMKRGELEFTTTTASNTFDRQRAMQVTVTDAPKLIRIRPDWSLYKDGEPKAKWGKRRG